MILNSSAFYLNQIHQLWQQSASNQIINDHCNHAALYIPIYRVFPID